MAFNEVSFIGYVGRDPEISATPQGDKVAKISVGSSVWSKDNPYTIWFTVYLWGGSANYTEKHIHKGDMVHVVSTIIADKVTGGPKIYERRDGTSGTSYEVKARLITRLVRKDSNAVADYEESNDYF